MVFWNISTCEKNLFTDSHFKMDDLYYIPKWNKIKKIDPGSTSDSINSAQQRSHFQTTQHKRFSHLAKNLVISKPSYPHKLAQRNVVLNRTGERGGLRVRYR